MTRIRVAGTVDVAVAVDFEKTVKEYRLQAKKNSTPIPTQSDLLEEVIKKGLTSCENKTAPANPPELILRALTEHRIDEQSKYYS